MTQFLKTIFLVDFLVGFWLFVQRLKGQADQVVRSAFQSLLEEAAKERLRERWGARIEGLARLAVDQFLNELDSSLGVEAILERQARASQTTESELADLFRGAARREPG